MLLKSIGWMMIITSEPAVKAPEEKPTIKPLGEMAGIVPVSGMKLTHQIPSLKKKTLASIYALRLVRLPIIFERKKEKQ